MFPQEFLPKMKTNTPKTIYLKDYKPSEYLIETVDLDISLSPTDTLVKSKLRIIPNPEVLEKSNKLVLDGESIKLQKVALNRKVLDNKSYKVNRKSLTLSNLPNRPFSLEIITTCNPKTNKALSGLYLSNKNYCTQCEAEGFRRITYYLDRPDILSIFTTRIEADEKEAPVLLSNGNLIEEGPARKKGRHFKTWHDPYPKPSYLFALVGGDLAEVKDTFKTKSKRTVNLSIFVEHGKEGRCDWAMDSLKRSMRWDEKRFGLEYDLDIFNIVAVSDFNMGAMENKSLNIFNDVLVLASPETATDNNYMAIESVIAHEYFHNWTGNRITCRDWFQLCLKEGLTVFRDQEFTSDTRSRTVTRIQNVRQLRAHQFPEDGGPLAHPVRPESYIEINNFYTSTVYDKGAELCRMLMTILGKDGFRKGMDIYFKRHDGGAKTVEDFVSAMADANDVTLDHFMLWYSQAGTPQIMAKADYNKRKKEATLTFTQVTPKTPGQTSKKPLHIPIKLGLIAPDGTDNELVTADSEKLKDNVIHLTKREQSITFNNIVDKPVPSLFREFSAPVQLNINTTEKELEFQALNDTDLFNRWQAAQTFSSRLMVELVSVIKAGKKSKKGSKLSNILKTALSDENLEPAYRAEFMRLPSEADIAREIGKNVNPQYIHDARKMLLSGISKDLKDELLKVYTKYAVRGKYTPTALNVGKRSLRNIALGLSCVDKKSVDIERASKHYHSAKNMTDKIAALSILGNTMSPEREEAFDHFYNQFHEDHLVLDKWFSIQASSSAPDAYERVKNLKNHPKFSLKNPNRARALIAVFAQSNAVYFNAEDGSGYELVGETVLEIDRFNPQIAARLCGAFKSWQMLETKRKNKAKKQLEHIASDKKLSRDTYEIVNKTLGLK